MANPGAARIAFFVVGCLLPGTLALWVAIFGETPDLFGRIVPFMLGLVWYLVGMMIIEAHQYIPFCIRRPHADWMQFIGGLICTAFGVLFCFVSFGDPRDEAFYADRWVIAAAGLTFFMFGVVLMRVAVLRPEDQAQDPLVALLVGVVCATFGAVALGVALTGTDKGTLSVGGWSFEAFDWMGSILPLPGALILAWLSYRQLKEWRRRLANRKSKPPAPVDP